VGNKKYFQLNAQNPFFNELLKLIKKEKKLSSLYFEIYYGPALFLKKDNLLLKINAGVAEFYPTVALKNLQIEQSEKTLILRANYGDYLVLSKSIYAIISNETLLLRFLSHVKSYSKKKDILNNDVSNFNAAAVLFTFNYLFNSNTASQFFTPFSVNFVEDYKNNAITELQKELADNLLSLIKRIIEDTQEQRATPTIQQAFIDGELNEMNKIKLISATPLIKKTVFSPTFFHNRKEIDVSKKRQGSSTLLDQIYVYQ
jgi:hypothetical protein